MEFDSAKSAFLQESNELLADMESALLELERDTANQDLINAIFRAAHTIKGTGGVFGFDNVVEFTHVAENVLDRVRADELRIDAELIAVLLKCRDYIGILVDLAVTDQSPGQEVEQAGNKLLAALQHYLGEEDCETDNPGTKEIGRHVYVIEAADSTVNMQLCLHNG